MVTTPDRPRTNPIVPLVIQWEPLPADFQLDDSPVDNTGQPLLANALREILELLGWIREDMLIATNFGLCATVNEQLVIKAPDWVYVPHVLEIAPDRRSYTPTLEGDRPLIVMEFLSDTDGQEYSNRITPPYGRWFFYETVLQVPIYVIFDPAIGLLEFYRLTAGHYQLEQPDEYGHHWIEEMQLYLGTWRGLKSQRDGYWLRWWDCDRTLLPWAIEKVETERQRAEQAEQRANQAEQQAEEERLRAEEERLRAEEERLRAEEERLRAEEERLRADRLAQRLREQGIDPETLI